ncbi:MAG TPA: hypothetical protein ENJ19_00725, partial [Gammaproteobacteria bacterium]|nr:hypothetical protein [Gammaproteobacteria bacterium]
MTTLVVGATGLVGSAVAGRLLAMGTAVRGMTRFASKIADLPRGVEGRVGDLDKPTTLGMAFDGARALFLVTPLNQHETELGLAAVAAARAAKLEKIVYLSVPMPAGADVIPHFRSKRPVEEAIITSGIAYTILRPNNFFQNDSLWCRAAVMSFGVYPQPIGSVGLNRVDVRDVADAAVNALSDSAFDGREYGLHGPDVLTGDGVAETFSRHLGRNISYGGDDLDAWAKQAQHMMPEWMVQDLRVMYDYFQRHGLIACEEELVRQQDILKRAPTRFDEFVTEIVALWRE